MGQRHLSSNEIVSLTPFGTEIRDNKTRAIVKTDEVELIRLVIPAGKELPTHQAPGPMTLQCLEGKIAFSAMGKTQILASGDLVFLFAGEPHSLTGIEDASLLLTIVFIDTKN